jgi:hypothetical protein
MYQVCKNQTTTHPTTCQLNRQPHPLTAYLRLRGSPSSKIDRPTPIGSQNRARGSVFAGEHHTTPPLRARPANHYHHLHSIKPRSKGTSPVEMVPPSPHIVRQNRAPPLGFACGTQTAPPLRARLANHHHHLNPTKTRSNGPSPSKRRALPARRLPKPSPTTRFCVGGPKLPPPSRALGQPPPPSPLTIRQSKRPSPIKMKTPACVVR